MADDLNSKPGRGAGRPGSAEAAVKILKSVAKDIAIRKQGQSKGGKK